MDALAFAVAAHLDSEIMIMDEVLAVGDVAFQKKCLDKMTEVSKSEGRTILYVSHNMNTIRQLCDRCIVLDHGSVAYDGDVLKGIDTYMRSSYNEGKTYYDFLYRKRERWSQLGEVATLISLELVGKDHPRYEYQEPIILKIDIKAKRSIEDISFRVEVISGDGVFIGSAFSEDVGALEQGQAGSFLLKLDMHNVIPGNYFATVVLFQKTSYQSSNDLDYVERAFSFEITDSEQKMLIAWNKEKWGHILLENMTLLDASMTMQGQ